MKNEVNTKPEGYLPGDILFGNLREISEGELLCKLDDKFAALVAAVMATGNKGSLTLQISVKRKGGVAQCEITPTVKASIPEASIPEASIPEASIPEASIPVRHRSIECVSPNVDGASCDGCQWADSDAMEADFICEDCMVCPHCGTRTGFLKKEVK